MGSQAARLLSFCLGFLLSTTVSTLSLGCSETLPDWLGPYPSLVMPLPWHRIEGSMLYTFCPHITVWGPPGMNWPQTHLTVSVSYHLKIRVTPFSQDCPNLLLPPWMAMLAWRKFAFVMSPLDLMYFTACASSRPAQQPLSSQTFCPFESAKASLVLRRKVSFLHESKRLKQPIKDCLKHFRQQLAKLKWKVPWNSPPHWLSMTW